MVVRLVLLPRASHSRYPYPGVPVMRVAQSVGSVLYGKPSMILPLACESTHASFSSSTGADPTAVRSAVR